MGGQARFLFRWPMAVAGQKMTRSPSMAIHASHRSVEDSNCNNGQDDLLEAYTSHALESWSNVRDRVVRIRAGVTLWFVVIQKLEKLCKGRVSELCITDYG